jgi:polysaccharide export outer membrane protein
MVYLVDSQNLDSISLRKYESTIQKGDKLSILVTALNPKSAEMFNLNTIVSESSNVTEATRGGGGYVVDLDGNIIFPQLGRIAAVGKTKRQLADKIEQMLSDNKLLTNPIVTVNFLNFRVNVLGEVYKPGIFIFNDGKVNVFDAIGMAGDLTMFGKRDNVLIIREEDNKRTFHRLNLNSSAIFSSPYFHLKQNDIVYVELTKNKLLSTDTEFTRNLSIASLSLAILSTLAIIFNVIK